MVRELSARAGALVAVLSGLLWSHVADAQSFVPPPIRPSIDENGVELRSGRIELTRTDIVIGQPGAGGLSFGGNISGSRRAPDTAWYSGAITSAPNGPSTTTYTVSVAGHAESFDKANTPSTSPFVSVQGLGSTLTQDAANYTYTSPDGTVATFSKSLTWVGQRIAAAHIVQLKLPDGEIRSFNYVQGTVTAPCTQMGCTIRRLQSVNNNRGYQISLTYFDGNLTIPSTDESNWYRISGAKGINLSVDYCSPSANTCTGLTQSWPTVSYGPIWPIPTSFATDQLGNTTTYTSGWAVPPEEMLSIRWPGSQTDDVVYTLTGPGADIVASVNRRGRIWTYTRSSTATEQTVVVTDPQTRQSTYVFDLTTGSIKSSTNTAGEVTTYQNDTKGRPSVVTLPTGETVRYQYDARGNMTEVRHTSSPAGTDLVSTAGYDSTCTTATAKKCNKPNWTRDAAGNQTDYVYANAHGNPTSITLPAPAVGGIRPATTYTFTALAAYYKNSTGSIVAAGTNVYYLTRVAECRTTSGCTATSADQLRTDLGYGANNVANNRLPVQTTVRSGSGGAFIATTALQYDGVGNLVSVNGPLSGTVDQTVTRYDALRRAIGTVGPDPDAAGPRLHIGVRTNYDSRGLPALVETGNLPGQADSSWTSFVPALSVVREFDAERRMTKTSSVAGATTHAVQQVSFDTFGARRLPRDAHEPGVLRRAAVVGVQRDRRRPVRPRSNRPVWLRQRGSGHFGYQRLRSPHCDRRPDDDLPYRRPAPNAQRWQGQQDDV